jgi:hypothetical protein
MPYIPKSKREPHINYNKKVFDGLSANKQIDDIIEIASILNKVEQSVTSNNKDISDLQSGKQDLLVSGLNIKTINGESVLGSGNIDISNTKTNSYFPNGW